MIHFNNKLPMGSRWATFLRKYPKVKKLFREAYATLEGDFVNTRLIKSAFYAKYLCLPKELKAEVSSVASYLKVSVSVVTAAQALYDTNWGLLEGAMATCGCTSVSFCHNGKVHFGRNLDWSYPDNAEDMVYHVSVDDVYVAECVAGLLGWVAVYGMKKKSPFFLSFNQAPKARSMRLTGVPAIWAFTNLSMKSQDPDSLANVSLMSDFLMHHGNGTVRELIEIHAGKVFKKSVDYHHDGLLVQTNRYAIAPAPIRKINPSFDQHSKDREAKVKRAYNKTGEIHSLLYAAEDDSTIDHFVME